MRVLINGEVGCWTRTTISELLDEEMIEVVCKLHFSRLGCQDKLIWISSNNKKFSVESAYYLEVWRRRREVGKTSNRQDKNKAW